MGCYGGTFAAMVNLLNQFSESASELFQEGSARRAAPKVHHGPRTPPMKSHSRRTFLRTAGTSLAGLGLFSIVGRSKALAQSPRKPNILLVFPDQLRPDWSSLNSSVAVRTPHLAALAAQGMRFDHAYCPSPLCAPSRACLAQGKAYGRTQVYSNAYYLTIPTG